MRRPAYGTRRGFTLVEAVTSIALMAMAGSALLLGVSSSLETTQNVVDEAIAAGMAQQLLDEMAGKLWCAPGGNPLQTTLGPTGPDAGPNRQNFTNLADYNGYTSQPPQDYFGIALGADDGAGGMRQSALQANAGYFSRWQQQVKVYYVSSSNFTTPLPTGQTSDYRAAEVRIFISDPVYGQRQLALARRIFAYVPTP